jgi:hypothetical protein
MPDVYTLPHTEEGLALLMPLTLTLRSAGYKTRVIERQLTPLTRVYQLLAVKLRGLSRKERGLA